MKKKIILIITILLTIALCAADKSETIKKKIDDINSKLKKIQSAKDSVLNQIYSIELRYEKEKIRLNSTISKIRKINRKISAKEREKALLIKDIDRTKTNLRKIIRIIYKIRGNAYLKMVVRLDDFNQLFKNYRLFVSLIDFNINEIRSLQNKIKLLAKIKEQLSQEKLSLENTRKTKRKNLNNIASLKKEKIKKINEINSSRQRYLKMLEEMKFEAENINKIIYNQQTKEFFKIKKLNFLRHKLNWPVKGRVISKFGKVRSTKFNTYVQNNGIEIKTGKKAHIKSVYRGAVVFVDYIKGYGNLIIIQHSKNLHTLYGRCSEILKKKGDMVKKGELIARTGEKLTSDTHVLYFELRKDLIAVNPLKWLRKK